MANIVLKKKVALTAACNLVQVGVEVAADDEDWNFIQAAAAECLESSMSVDRGPTIRFVQPSPGQINFTTSWQLYLHI